MKQILKRPGFARLLVGCAVVFSSMAILANVSSPKKNAYASVNLGDLTKITSANAECSSTFCSGAGSGCTITVEGTNFTSSVCKGK